MDINKCLICERSVLDDSFGKVIQKPRRCGLQAIINMASKRNDEVYSRIIPHRTLLESMKYIFRYHQDCYRNYTSQTNFEHHLAPREKNSDTNENKIHDRRKLPSFDIRKMCIICNKAGTLKKKKLVPISTGTGESTRIKILQAAEYRQDYEMISKMKTYIDLFAMDAKYHQACYSHYISKRNLMYCKNNNVPTDLPTTSTASEKSIGDATFDRQTSNSSHSEEFLEIDGESENIILHKAAGIITQALSSHNTSSKSYPRPENITLEKCRNQVPMKLLYLISCILNDDDYDNGFIADHVDISVLAVCNAILGNSSIKRKSKNSLLSLCLGLQIYYTTKSKTNIETLHSMGYSCSYDEIRIFLTSVANYNLEKTKNGLHIPRTLRQVSEKDFIHASIDNFDINEETIDGKNTTHCMATVVFQNKTDNDMEYGGDIPRHPKCRSLSVDGTKKRLEIYKKKMSRPEPPKYFEQSDLEIFDKKIKFSNIDLLWNVGRFTKQTALNWSDFNNELSSNMVSVSTIQYLPFINAPPTDYDTILTSIVNLVQISEQLGQNHIIITADLAIYSKAQEILWNNADLKESVTLQLGGMHLLMAFIASLGTIFGDGGLKNILVESDLFAESTCNQILKGKQYYRGIRALTLAGHALSVLFLEELSKEDHSHEPIFDSDSESIYDNLDMNTINSASWNEKWNQIQENIEKFRTEGEKRSRTFTYWMMFLDGVNLLWQYLRSERNGEFENHLSTVAKMIAYLRCAGRFNYAKFVPVYLSDMKNLRRKHPKMYNFLAEGNFVVKKTDEKKFDCVASDMALEQSINRDCKSHGGVISFTQKPQTLLRWMVTRHSMGEYVNNFGELLSTNNSSQRQQSENARKRDQEDIEKMLNCFKHEFTNPFDASSPEELINITTGQIAPKYIEDSLMTCLDTTKNNNTQFILKTLSPESEGSFWKTSTTKKVKTFSDYQKNTGTKKDKCIVIGSDAMFRRVITIARLKKSNLADILSYELTGVPLSIFHEDSTMRKTTKSDLKKRLEEHSVTSVIAPSSVDALILDGMVLVQEMKELRRTFNELGQLFMDKILLKMKKFQTNNITIVFDRYDREISLKSIERQRRGDKIEKTFSIKGDRSIPKFRDFLKSSMNKHNLVIFLAEYICTNIQTHLHQHSRITIAGGFETAEECRVIMNDSITNNLYLKCNHEEADTRLILHLLEESKSSSNILVQSDDTDVLVIILYFSSIKINLAENTNIYLQTGHANQASNKLRYIHVNSIITDLGTEFCKNLPAIHALTGSDTTNALFKIGKKSAFDIAWKKRDDIKSLAHFHSAVTDCVDIARNYVMKLYKNEDTNVTTLDQLRQKFTVNTFKSSAELPPTENAFTQHVLRCALQCKIWCNSDIAMMEEFDMFQFGWEKKGSLLKPVYSTLPPIPEEIREMLNITCSDKSCNSRKCQCNRDNLKCTDACKCKNCENMPYTSEEGDEIEFEY